jgi:hypothetical protein
VVAKLEDLTPEVKLSEQDKYKNISMGIQISPKREKLFDPVQKALEEAFPEDFGVVS